MSRPVSYSSAVSFNVAEYSASTFTTSSTYPTSNGCDGSGSTNYARFTVSTTSQYAIYNFNITGIPSNATINSVSCVAKVAYSGSNFSTRTIQMYAGNTAKGSSTTINVQSASSISTTTLSVGSWALSELSNAKIRINGQVSRGSNRYILFYGATLTVNYSASATEYEVSITNNSTVTTDPTGSVYIMEGGSEVIRINTTNVSTILVSDNGSIVTPIPFSNISCATTLNPNSFSASSSSYTTSGENGYNSTSNTSSYAQLRGSSNTQYTTQYYFNTSQVPNNAENITVTCSLRGRSPNGTDGSYVGYAVLRTNTTEKGSRVTINSNDTNGAIFDLTDSGNWTYAELNSLNLYLLHPYGGSNRYVYFYGANLTINYTIPGGTVQYYTYTISNISADHSIVINDAVSHTVSISSTYTGATVSPLSVQVADGGSATFTITISSLDNITVKDNNVDVTSSVTGGSGTYYYTLTNVVADHTIILSYEEPSTGMYIKTNGTWVELVNLWKMVGGVWTEMTVLDFSEYVADKVCFYGGEMDGYPTLGSVSEESVITINNGALSAGTYTMVYEDSSRIPMSGVNKITEFTIA